MAEDNAKRRQIIDDARRTFLQQGFDATSMNDIARAAGCRKEHSMSISVDAVSFSRNIERTTERHWRCLSKADRKLGAV